MIKVKPLTDEMAREAVNLVDTVFPEQEREPARLEIPASLNPKGYKDFLSENQMSDLKYWIASNNSGKIVGVTGLYCYEFDKNEACWLGWFCVDPTVRKQGIGAQLLRFSIKEAKKQDKKFLRLYTSTDPNESASHRLYEKYGFRLIREGPLDRSGFRDLYYELELKAQAS